MKKLLSIPDELVKLTETVEDNFSGHVQRLLQNNLNERGIRGKCQPLPLITAEGLDMSVEEMHIKQRKLYLTSSLYRKTVQGMPGFEHLWSCKS